MEQWSFVQATKRDVDSIKELYASLVGTPYCAWTDTYPGEKEIEFDLSRQALYCLKNGEKIVGVVSIDQDEQVEQLPCWTAKLQPSVELSRVGVATEYQNQGIACRIIEEMLGLLYERGIKSIHYLVAKKNLKALKAYRKLHPNTVGDCCLYDTEWWCCEIVTDRCEK